MSVKTKIKILFQEFVCLFLIIKVLNLYSILYLRKHDIGDQNN